MDDINLGSILRSFIYYRFVGNILVPVLIIISSELELRMIRRIELSYSTSRNAIRKSPDHIQPKDRFRLR